jgi:hypothetical protein
MRRVPLTPELVYQMASLAGIDLEIERARDLIPALEPVFEGDEKIAELDLHTLSAVGNPWPEVDDA